MRIVRFLPAVLAAVTDVVTAAMVRANQPDYPGRIIVFQIVMLGAALLATVPKMWVRLTGIVLLLAGAFISGISVGIFYVPTVITVWLGHAFTCSVIFFDWLTRPPSFHPAGSAFPPHPVGGCEDRLESVSCPSS